MKKIFSKLGLLGRLFALQAVFFGGLFAIASTAQAEMPVQPQPLWAEQADGEAIAKDARRDPNKYCVDCHGRFDTFKHEGKHFQKETVSPNNGQPLNCVTCHGNISENHRKGVKDVMRFHGYGKSKNPEMARSAQEQNQVCFACHAIDQLREKFWAHDTHANKMACVNCHQLHPEKEPMKGIEQKDRIKLCVDCHSNIHERKAKQLEQAKEQK